MKERAGTAKHFLSAQDKKHLHGGEKGKGQKEENLAGPFPPFFFLMYLFGCFHFHNSPTGSGTHFCTQHEVCSSAGCQANHKAPQQSCCLASLLPFAHPKPPHLLSVGCSSLKSAGGCLEDSPHPAAHPPIPTVACQPFI